MTFTPRLLLVDLKGSLNGLPEKGTLYGDDCDPAHSYDGWPKELVDVEVSEPSIESKFTPLPDSGQNNCALDENVKVWSDYLYARFHPRTVNVVKNYEMGNEHTPFDSFTIGKNIWKSVQFEEDFNDKIRQYVEECDNFQVTLSC